MTKQLMYIVVSCGLFSLSYLCSFVTGSLTNDITSCLIDENKGIFYATIEATTGQPGIVQASNPTGAASPEFSGFNDNTVGLGYRNLITIPDKNAIFPTTVAAIVADATTGLYNRFVVTHAYAYDMSATVQDDATNDQNNTQGVANAQYIYSNGSDDAEILSIAAASDAIFAVVHRFNNDFLTSGSALNMYRIVVDTTSISIHSGTYFQRALNALDFIVGNGSAQIGNVSNIVKTCYNSDLKTLYCAPRWITSDISKKRNGTVYSTGVCSVAAYRFDDVKFTLSPFQLHATAQVETNSWGSGDQLNPSTQNIVGVLGQKQTLSVHDFNVMSTSTGKYYMIVLGGNGTVSETGNAVYALPLVGPKGDVPGSLAKVSDSTHMIQAQYVGDLYTAATKAAIVGGGLLPWGLGNFDQQMVVLNDAVYVSIDNPVAKNPGVYYSQAQFNDKGNIAGWTPWHLAVPRALGSAAVGVANQGAARMFAVNLMSGKVWVVPSDNTDSVHIPSWIQPARSITRAITRDIVINDVSPQENVHDVLQNIDFRTSWQAQDTDNNKYKFLGYIGKNSEGIRQLVVIRTGPDDATTNAENFRIIDLPAYIGSADSILSIAFLQSPSTDVDGAPTGMFLIGTQTALYAYLNPTNHHGGYVNGTQANTFDLNQGYWTNAAWEHVLPNVFNSNVSSIDALYKDLYILHRAIRLGQNDVLYKIAVDDISGLTIQGVTPIVVHQADFTSDTMPYMLNHIIVPSTDDTTTEQVVVGSYGGAFNMTAQGGMQNITQAAQVTITPIESTQNQKIVALARTSDNQSSIITQDTTSMVANKTVYIAPTSTGTVTTAVTATTTIAPTTPANSTNNAASDIIDATFKVWTDGARNFVISGNSLVSKSTGSVYENITSVESALFKGKKLKSIEISASGVILVGTDQGVMSLY